MFKKRFKSLQAHKTNPEISKKLDKDRTLPSGGQSIRTIQHKDLQEEEEADPHERAKLLWMCSQEDYPPYSDESFSRYYQDQRSILFTWNTTLNPHQEQQIDLSSNRNFDILALDSLLFQAQMNAPSKHLVKSESPAENFRIQLVLLKFICANGPCTTRNDTNVKKASYLVQREIFELKQLLKVALKEQNGLYGLCDEISWYHSWCLENGLIDKKMYEIVEKYVEQNLEEPKYSNSFQPQKQLNESIRRVCEVRTIYGKVLMKLNYMISQINKKSFYYINRLLEDLHYETLPTNKCYDQDEILRLAREICEHIEALAEDFYKDILEKDYTVEEKEDLFRVTGLDKLKMMISDTETDFDFIRIREIASAVLFVFYLKLQVILLFKLPTIGKWSVFYVPFWGALTLS